MDSTEKYYYKNITLQQALVGGKFKIQLDDGKTIKVKLKPGSYTGQIIRLKNEVNNVLITLNVLDHPIYHIDGLNLVAVLVATPAEAMLGTQRKMPGPDGETILVNIPKNTVENQEITLENMGLKQKEIAGNLVFKVKIEDLSSIEDELKSEFKRRKRQELLN